MSETNSGAVRTKPSRAVRKLLVALASAMAGAALGYFAVDGLMHSQSQLLQLESPGLVLLSLVPIVFTVILIHELGHVLGGWLSGQRFHMLIVGPVRITRDLGGMKLELNRSFAMAGGIAVCLPQNLQRFRRDRLLMVVMGPLASAFLAVACGLGAFSLSGVNSSLTDILTITALCSSMIWLVTSLPHQAGGFPSDGAQIMGLLRGGEDSEKLSLIMLLYSLSLSGTRPRDWSTDLLQRANLLRSKQTIYNATAELLAYTHHLDCHQYDLAQTYLERALADFDDLAKGLRQGFALEAAYFWAIHRHDLQKAMEWFQRGRGGIVEPSTRSRVEAAIHLLKGEKPQALEKIRLARSQLRTLVDRGSALAESDMLDTMEATPDLHSALTGSTPVT